MTKKHKRFINAFNCAPVSYCTSDGKSAMRVEIGSGIPVVITKEEAESFFDLVPAPEPEKPIHAALIKSFAEGNEIEYRYVDAMPADKWWKLDPNGSDSDRYAVAVFMGNGSEQGWLFRAKSE